MAARHVTWQGTARREARYAKSGVSRGGNRYKTGEQKALAEAMKLTGMILRLVIAYLIVIAGIAMFQDRLLYFPAKATQADMTSGGLRAWPAPQDFRGLVAEPSGPVRGTAIVFHGNAGHAGHRVFYAKALTQLGLRVILAEYPGYGPRDGAVGEQNLVADAEQTIALAHSLHGAPLLLIGESLGAAVAAAAAARQRDKTAGLLLITPWDRLENVGTYHYPWLPVKWLLRDRYDSVTHLASFGRPILVAVAERDSIVPARFGTALYESLAEPKRLTVLKAAEHNDWIARVDETWWREAITFVLGASR
jgi:pimeloyl-ACP methyl ester carboxylesterase